MRMGRPTPLLYHNHPAPPTVFYLPISPERGRGDRARATDRAEPAGFATLRNMGVDLPLPDQRLRSCTRTGAAFNVADTRRQGIPRRPGP